MLIIAGLANAQPLAGIKTIPGNYATIQAAIAALNTAGVGSGGVTFIVALNHAETLANPAAGVITATGTAADSIIFKKATGSGLNPRITSCTTATSTVNDGIVRIAGGDYIVFDGIDLQDNAANNTNAKRFEWGYALLKKQGTAPYDGCQHVVIKNCTISLNKLNPNSVGIYSGNHVVESNTSLPITSAGDACNNCKFYSNYISNVYSGIQLHGYNAPAPYTLYDQNNEIGTDGANTITNYGGLSSTCFCISCEYQHNLKIFNNTINGGTTSASALYAISFGTANTASGEIAYNTITAPGNSSTGAVYGINCEAGTGGTSNTIAIHDNILTNCAASGIINIIYYSSNANTVNIYNNTINGATGTGTLQAIYAHPAVTTGSLNIYNNDISNLALTNSSKLYGIIGGGYTETSIYLNSLYNCSSNGNWVYGISASASGTWNWNVERNNLYNLASNNGASTNSLVYGIYLQGGTGVNATIQNNFISDLKANLSTKNPAVAGLYLSAAAGFNVSYNTVFLNASSTGSTFGTVAVYCSTTPTLTLRNNIFINISTPGATGRTVCYMRSSTSLTTYSSSSDNNNFYAGIPGARNLIYYNGTQSDQTIETYMTRVSPRDSQSFSEETAFQNDTLPPYDLHIKATIPTFCESGGITVAVPNLTNDFDGDSRYPNAGYPDHPTFHATAPDVGADEFGGLRNDLLPPVISYLPLKNTSSTGPRTIIADISDATSGIPASVPGLPVLYWKINDAPAWNSAVGSLTGTNQYGFTFGNGVVLSDVVYYYVCAQDGFMYPNVTVSPAAGAGGLAANPPSCSAPPSTPYAYRIVGTLPAGNYLVGGTGNTPSEGCTYVDITQAFADVNNVVDHIVVTDGGIGYYSPSVTLTGGGGSGASAMAITDENGVITEIQVTNNGDGFYMAPTVEITGTGSGASAVAYISAGKEITGPVSFVIDTSYRWNEENAFPVHLEPVVGSGPANTITLKPGPLSTPTIYAYNGSCIIKINGADYFTLDGSNNGSSSKDLTLSLVYEGIYAAVVWIASATDIDGATHNTVKNCVIRGSGSTTYNYAGIFSGGTEAIESYYYALSPNSYNTFENNNIYYARNGIVALGKSPSEPDEGVAVRNNQLGNDVAGEGFTNQGIFIENQHAGAITGNHIQNIIYNSQYNYVAGIYLSNSKNMLISANRIHNLRQALYQASWYVDGIYQITPAFNTAVNPSENTYANNVIYDLTSNGETSYYNVVGIHNAKGWGDKYYYNSVYLSGQLNKSGSSNGSMSACFSNGQGVNSTYAPNIDVKNNIFYINSYNPSGVNHHYAHYANLNSYAGSTLDYNLMLDSVSGTAVGHIGYFNGTNHNDIYQWRASTLQDPATLSADPLFNSPANLAPRADSPALGAGTPVAGISTDITNSPRDPAHPSIGAYENAMTPAKTWNGTISSDWSNGSNWTPAGVPGISDNVIIPSGTIYTCEVTGTGMVCNNISIDGGATISFITGSEITVFGNMTISDGGTLTNDGVMFLKGNLENQNTAK